MITDAPKAKVLVAGCVDWTSVQLARSHSAQRNRGVCDTPLPGDSARTFACCEAITRVRARREQDGKESQGMLAGADRYHDGLRARR
jgi:hypothetical protein